MTARSEASRRDEPVDPLAESVADGVNVDWPRERSSRSEDAGVVDALELIARVSRLAEASPDASLDVLADGTPVPAAWGSLRLESTIGRGTFGTVYRARDLLLDEHVAVKVLRPGSGGVVGRLVEEGRRLARLRHPNIVRVICIDEHEDLIGLRMELIRGRTLAELLETDGTFSESVAVEVGLAICHALTATHEAGLLHRDVKATNVMRDADGRIVLMDLGAGIDHASDGGSGPQGVVGTPLYVAPEVLERGVATPGSDLYSLGVLLHLLVTGEYPVRASSMEELRSALATRTTTSVRERRPELSEAFAHTIDRALAHDPTARWESAGEMAAALEKAREIAGSDTRVEPFLPRFLTRYVGRERLHRDVGATIRERRLVTLTGTGGCGKTRTAVEIARSAASWFPGGVWFVELTHVADPRLVSSVIAGAIGAKPVATESLLDAVITFLADRRALLVLDGCEHVTAACADAVGRIVHATQNVSILATSREALRVPGEVSAVVPPLELPHPERPRLGDVRTVESVRLFTDRARAADGRFALSEANATSTAQICRRVDGIPLAIELVAVYTATLPIDEIARLIDECLLDLGHPGTGTLPHHGTLRALVGWSYDFLSRAERTLLRRLSVFSGGWTVESATDVCSDDTLDASDVPSLHYQLVARSLITLDTTSRWTRYHMLDTIRSFAAERLTEEEPRSAVDRRHVTHFLDRARNVAHRGPGGYEPDLLDRMDRDLDNIRAALRRCRASGDVGTALEMVANLAGYFERRGHWHEARTLGSELADHPDAARYPRHHAPVLRTVGNLAAAQGDREEAQRRLGASLTLFRELGDDSATAQTLNNVAILAIDRGDTKTAQELLTEALAVRRRLGTPHGIVQTLVNLAVLAVGRESYPEATGYLEEGLALAREADLRELVKYCLRNLAATSEAEGRLDEARRLLEEAIGDDEQFESPYVQALCATDLGGLARRQGRLDDARALLMRALRVQYELGDARACPITLVELGFVAEASGDLTGAVQHFAAADERWPHPRQRRRHADELDPLLARVRRTLGDTTYETAWESGRRRSLESFLHP